MKPMPGLDDLLSRAVGKGIFGTKEHSVIGAAGIAGIAALVPILEPEVTVTIADEADAQFEAALDEAIQAISVVSVAPVGFGTAPKARLLSPRPVGHHDPEEVRA